MRLQKNCRRVLAAWLLLAGTAQAATLSGFVTDADSGEALTRVTVAVEGLQLAAISNNSGYYAVVQVPAGTHVVSASHAGYQTWRDTLRFGADEAVRLDLALVPKPVDLGEQVSVETERISLRVKPLQQMPALGETDLLRGLQLLPGIQAVADISSGLYVRGGGPDQTAILLDQTPLYNPSHLFGLFSTFNPDAIKKVDLYKGAYPAPYGRTLGAVLDVSNREGNRKRTSGRGGVSLISGRLLTEGPVGQGSWMLAGRRTYLDGVFSALRARGEDIPLNYFFYDLNGNINQRRGDDTYTAGAYWGQDDLRIELEDDEESFVDMRWGNRVLTTRWTRAFSPALFGHLMAAGSSYESIVALRFLDAPVRIANSSRDLSLKGDLDYFANRHHTLSLGLLATLFEFHFVRSFNERTQLDLRQEPVLLEGYVQDEWRLGLTTRVQLGGRGTYFSEGNRWHFTPRLSLSQALSDKIRVKAGGGVYRQHLQLITTEAFSGGDFWVPLDDTVEPGRSYQAVTGVEWTPWPRYLLSVDAYYTDLANLVTVDTELPDDSEATHSEAVFKSGGTGWARGIEVFLQRRTGALTGWIGYALGWTRRTFPELNDGRPFPPKYDRRHDLSFVASYEVGSWRLGANLAYATGQAFTPVSESPVQRNSARLQPYHRLDVSASRSFELRGTASEFYVQIFNVYSRRNEWFVQLDSVDPEVDPRKIKQLPIIPTLGFNFSF
ncbi:MAG: carboxypeptidase regulatory-like domain-containing protein [Gemmatimonadetes bacterium]|nr:carboxypeptidase regulatory-like domain-containing protein [Gemmatimonadota bacterium]